MQTIAACTTKEAVEAGETTQFSTTGPFTLYADDFAIGEHAVLYREGPSGEYKPATNKTGSIYVSAFPNMTYVDAGGNFQIRKDETAAVGSIGYEEA